MDILALDQVSKSFGALKVADGISFAVPQGQALGIIGPNGAGKSTLFNLVTGTGPVVGEALVAAGISNEVAVAAVLANQLVANFIPAVPGWWATNDLLHDDYL